MWKRLLVNLLIGILVGGLIALGDAQWSLFRRIELSLYNTRFETFRGPRAPDDDIVILAMDEASLEELGPFPWTRDIHANLVDKLMTLGARMVAIDIMFQNPSNFPEADKLLESTFRKYKDKVVLVSKFDYGTTSRISGSGAGSQEGQPVDAASYTTPLFENAASFGFADFPEDVDGQIRQGRIVKDLLAEELMPTPMTIDKKFEPAFSFRMLQQLDPGKAKQLLERYGENLLWINFAGPPQRHNTVSYYIPYKLGQPGFDKNYFQQLVGQRPEDFFKNKIVFIGATAEALQDNKNAPFVALGNTKMPGVEIHANMFETLRQNIPYAAAPMWANVLLVLGFGVATALLLSFLRPLSGLALALLLIAVYSVVNIYFFSQRLFVDWFAPLLAVGLAYTVTYAYRFLVEEREKRRIRKFFNSYVSPKLVEELLKDPSTMPSLKSERRMVSMLFSDIAGFTSMSESLPPDEVEHILNEYLTAMSQIVFENDGTLDKYIGDAVMAVWGNVGPTSPKTDAYKAVNTAIQMQRVLAHLREKWLGEGMVPLQIRIGVNTGEALVGNFGSPQKMDYTVIGDAVNTAARLEGLNKEFGTSILISQSTYDLVSDRLNARHCGTVKVKGKEEPVSVFEALGWKDEGAAQTEIRDTKWIKGTNETQWK
ncbi:MAG: CHASE2 domain-containing protein [Candidatus Sericytochromatia bacterium]